MQETWVRSLMWVDPLEKERATHSSIVFLPGKSHGQRNLAGYSPWGPKELDMTERGTHTHTLNGDCTWKMFQNANPEISKAFLALYAAAAG